MSIACSRVRFSFILLLFTLHFFCIRHASAQQPREEYRRIQKDIRTHKQKLESVKKKEKSVLEELKKTTSELNEIERQLAEHRDKIKRLNAGIAALQADIKSGSAVLQDQRTHLKKRLRALRMLTSNKDALLALLSGEDIAQTMRIERYLGDIANYDYGLIRKYKSELQDMADKERGLKELYVNQKIEEKSLAKLEVSLIDKKKEREALLASVRKEKGIFENMIKELRETSSRLLAIIRETERREREARKRSAKTRPGAIEEEPQDDSGFSRMKGKLIWPVTGRVELQYGTQVDPIFNLPVFRSGIHVKTENGAPVRAVHDGKVVFAENFKGYGQLVIINHGGGYHSLYGNLAKIFSKNGAIIKGQQIIGEVGESNALGTSGLYFEIRYKGKPLDPQQWLTR